MGNRRYLLMFTILAVPLAMFLVPTDVAEPQGSYDDEPRLVGLCIPEGGTEYVRMLAVEEDEFPAGIVQPDGTIKPSCKWIAPI